MIYPRLVPQQGAYRDTPHRWLDTPNARAAVPELLCLPMFPELRPDEAREVVTAIGEFYRDAGAGDARA